VGATAGGGGRPVATYTFYATLGMDPRTRRWTATVPGLAEATAPSRDAAVAALRGQLAAAVADRLARGLPLPPEPAGGLPVQVTLPPVAPPRRR
jgi:hypothetical protein